MTWTFVGLFVLGAMAAGALMELAIGNGVTVTLGSMAINERFTLVSNIAAFVATLAVAVAARRGRPGSSQSLGTAGAE